MGELSVAGCQWRVVSGEWLVVNGELPVVSCRWRVASVLRRVETASGTQRKASPNHSSLAISH
jgi:hypothetical protein